MATATTSYEAVKNLQERLQSRIDADYGATFAPYGGADVVIEDDEDSLAQIAGKPCIVLSVTRNEPAGTEWGEGARTVVVRADVWASEFAGATTGVANPVGSDTLLSEAMHAIVAADFIEFNELGLFDIQARAAAQEVRDDEGQPMHINRHEITFVLFE